MNNDCWSVDRWLIGMTYNYDEHPCSVLCNASKHVFFVVLLIGGLFSKILMKYEPHACVVYQNGTHTNWTVDQSNSMKHGTLPDALLATTTYRDDEGKNYNYQDFCTSDYISLYSTSTSSWISYRGAEYVLSNLVFCAFHSWSNEKCVVSTWITYVWDYQLPNTSFIQVNVYKQP